MLKILVHCDDEEAMNQKKNDIIKAFEAFNSNDQLSLNINHSLISFENLRFEFVHGRLGEDVTLLDDYDYVYSKDLIAGVLFNKSIVVGNFDVIVFAFFRRLLFCNPTGLASLVANDMLMDAEVVNKVFNDFMTS